LYEFNYRHRLVLSLEKRFIVPGNEITDEEIAKYYQEHSDRFIRPMMAKFYIVDETQGPIAKIWADTTTGLPFRQAVEKYQEKFDAKLQETPINHLDPEVKEVALKLADGETSPIFNAQGIRLIFHMVERTPESPIPLDRVTESIKKQIAQEKMQERRSSYLNDIKSHFTIEIKQNKWEKALREIVEQ
jgi:hypothetical protein